jgi:hypothetical protein
MMEMQYNTVADSIINSSPFVSNIFSPGPCLRGGCRDGVEAREFILTVVPERLKQLYLHDIIRWQLCRGTEITETGHGSGLKGIGPTRCENPKDYRVVKVASPVTLPRYGAEPLRPQLGTTGNHGSYYFPLPTRPDVTFMIENQCIPMPSCHSIATQYCDTCSELV